jgi:anti-sigma B factor antagonist
MVSTPGSINPRFADANVRVELAHWDGYGRVAIIGEIDLSNVRDVEASLRDIASSGTALTLDLIGLTYLDSQGVSMIFRLAKRAQLNGGTLTLANPRNLVRRVLQIAHLDDALAIIDDV